MAQILFCNWIAGLHGKPYLAPLMLAKGNFANRRTPPILVGPIHLEFFSI